LGDTSLGGQVALSQAAVTPQLTKDCACLSLSVHVRDDTKSQISLV
jgi:hypothetical protein